MKIFLATPLDDGRVHHSYMMGTIQMALEFQGELIVGKIGSSYRPQNHDRLSYAMTLPPAPRTRCGRLASTAGSIPKIEHLATIGALGGKIWAHTRVLLKRHGETVHAPDGFIGWGAADLEKLLSANKDFVCGNYARKQQDRGLASELRGRREGKLIQAKYAAAGFVLLTRACVERLVHAHPELKYETPHGPAWALWSPIFQRVPRSEDISFSKRWQDLGQKIWVHSEVILRHYGETIYLPEPAEDSS
ncbi:MAG TPA: hypothetical protein VJV79_16100 [Polyangiaceae bacterium]|nr:hypothetical protein [Polyangiaceae bacterium]